jgi:hypothetical protein
MSIKLLNESGTSLIEVIFLVSILLIFLGFIFKGQLILSLVSRKNQKINALVDELKNSKLEIKSKLSKSSPNKLRFDLNTQFSKEPPSVECLRLNDYFYSCEILRNVNFQPSLENNLVIEVSRK